MADTVSGSAAPLSVLGVLEDLGWDLEGDVGYFAEAVQDSLEAVLGPRSSVYELVVKAIASRLGNGAELDEET